MINRINLFVNICTELSAVRVKWVIKTFPYKSQTGLV